VISGRDDRGELYAVRAPVDVRIGTAVFVPPEPLSTEVARGLLPQTVPHADAAADAGKAALLVAALGGHPDQLWRATRDHLHQEYRRPAMPASLDLVDRLRADGHAAVVSGAGPSVLVLVPDGTELAAYCPDGWTHHRPAVDTRGAVIG
jgi:homoserine kinase